jgi:glucose/arabinose dehydrogenase
MNVIQKIAILCCLGLLSVSAAAAQDQSAPGATSQPAAPAPPTGQNSSPPEPQQPSAQQPPATQNQPQAAPLPETPSQPVLKHRKKKKLAHRAQSGKVVVRNGGVKDDSVVLAPAMSKDQARSSRDNTTKLLASTDANLKNVAGRQLSPAQQNMLDEIHAYVRQSKGAMDAGDLARAHTLAYKALQLSGELAKK